MIALLAAAMLTCPLPNEAVARAVTSVDVRLVRAVIETESNFDANATSKAGAQGLMQLVPVTARQVGTCDSYNVFQNVIGGTRYLRGLLDRYHGDVRLALAAYNAGPGAVDRYGDVPPYAETQAYVARVLGVYAKNVGADPHPSARATAEPKPRPTSMPRPTLRPGPWHSTWGQP